MNAPEQAVGIDVMYLSQKAEMGIPLVLILGTLQIVATGMTPKTS